MFSLQFLFNWSNFGEGQRKIRVSTQVEDGCMYGRNARYKCAMENHLERNECCCADAHPNRINKFRGNC